jgi:hypothetical protein
MVGMTKSHAHDATQSWPLHVSADTPRNTAERRCNVTTPRATGTKVAQLQPSPSSSREVPPGIAIQGAEEGIKASKKRHKQRRQDATTNDDGDINEQASSASVEHVVEAVGNSKRQAGPPTYHFKKIL